MQDIDKGLDNIMKEINSFNSMYVKAGVVEGAGSKDGVSIAQYASWNEFGVPGKASSKKMWKIPPRPFIGGWATNKKKNINLVIQKLFATVQSGQSTADVALKKLGQYAQDGIKSYIRTGGFTPNAPSTIAKKKSSTPLIDSGTMRNSIRYEVKYGSYKQEMGK